MNTNQPSPRSSGLMAAVMASIFGTKAAAKPVTPLAVLPRVTHFSSIGRILSTNRRRYRPWGSRSKYVPHVGKKQLAKKESRDSWAAVAQMGD